MEKVQCPICKNWAQWKDNAFRPFCSEWCKTHDLGKWATEQYRVPVVEEEIAELASEKQGKKEEES